MEKLMVNGGEKDMYQKKAVEAYQGVERLNAGQGTVARDPVQKGDRFEWNAQGYLVRIFRNERPLYWLGQRIGWTPEGEELVVLHLTVENTPGSLPPEELEKEGFACQADFNQAWAAAYGGEALWCPAWRIRCGVNKLFIETEDR